MRAGRYGDTRTVVFMRGKTVMHLSSEFKGLATHVSKRTYKESSRWSE